MKKVLTAIIIGIIEGLADLVLVVSGIGFAVIFLVISLSIWLLYYTVIALSIVTLLLVMTTMWRYKMMKDRARRPEQCEKIIYVIDILMAVEMSQALIIMTGFTLSNCLLILGAAILATVKYERIWNHS